MRCTTLTQVPCSASVIGLKLHSTMAMAQNMRLKSLWNAVNAVTQVETSTRNTTRAKGVAQFARGTFGAGAQISKKAFQVAQDLLVQV